MARPNSSRLINNPITPSCIRTDFEKQIDFLLNRLSQVRRVRCFSAMSIQQIPMGICEPLTLGINGFTSLWHFGRFCESSITVVTQVLAGLKLNSASFDTKSVHISLNPFINSTQLRNSYVSNTEKGDCQNIGDQTMSYQREFENKLNLAIVGVGGHAYWNMRCQIDLFPCVAI